MAAVDVPVDLGQGGAGEDQGPVWPVEGEGTGGGSDDIPPLVDEPVMVFTQADQVLQAGPAAVDPVLDVMQVDPAGLAAGEPAPALVPFPGRPAQRRARPARRRPTSSTVPSWSCRIQDKVAVQASIWAVLTLTAGPSST